MKQKKNISKKNNHIRLQAKKKEWDDLQTRLKESNEKLEATKDTLEETEFIVTRQQATEEKLFGEAETVRDTLEVAGLGCF